MAITALRGRVDSLSLVHLDQSLNDTADLIGESLDEAEASDDLLAAMAGCRVAFSRLGAAIRTASPRSGDLRTAARAAVDALDAALLRAEPNDTHRLL